jgi:hypothetical protein
MYFSIKNCNLTPTMTVGVVNVLNLNTKSSFIGSIGPTGPTGSIGSTGPTGSTGQKGPDALSNIGFIAVFGGNSQLNSEYLSYNGKYDTNTSSTLNGFKIPVACVLKGYSYAIQNTSSNGKLQINKNGTVFYYINANNSSFNTLGGVIDVGPDDEPKGYKTFEKGDYCEVLTSENAVFGNCTITLYFTPQCLTAMVSGHGFRISSQFTPSVAEGQQMLGIMRYSLIGKLFASISPSDHYGTSGQWIQANDALKKNGKTWPWASIEGGVFISETLGRVRYHVAASSHRYNNRSDTLGGFGFFEAALPFKYWSRVVMSDTLLLPPYGVCFPSADDGKLFGAGWIGMPFFDFSSANIAKDPISWTFFADAENFSGPVCCYPPQFFARRIQSWGNVRLAEDKSLPPEYATTDISAGLGFTGPPGAVNVSVGGEIPNIKCAFTLDIADGSMVWKVPEIQLPAEGNVWGSDTSFFTEKNYVTIKEKLEKKLSNEKVTLLPKISSVSGTLPFEIGVKRVVEVGVTEIDSVLKIDAKVVPTADGNAYCITGPDTGKPLSRYYVQTNDIKDSITNGTGKTVNRRWCVPTGPPEVLKNIEYNTGSKPVTFKNDILKAYVSPIAFGGIKTVVLEDGTTVEYGLVKFNEQPAIASLAVDFPSDFTQSKLDELQARFEFLMTSDFRNQTRRSSWTQDPGKLTRVDPAMIIPEGSRKKGYVPIAVGSYAGATLESSTPAPEMYSETW